MVNISKETQIQDQFSVMLETRPTYTLYNQSTGALVREGTFLREGDLLDFNTLPSGIYVLRLQIGNDTYETHKIVLNNGCVKLDLEAVKHRQYYFSIDFRI